MPKVEIIGPEPGGMGDALAGYGTQIFLDGVELTPTRSIAVDIPLDGVLTVRAEVLVTERFSFVGHAEVRLTAVVLPGYLLVVETDDQGVTRYGAERDPKWRFVEGRP